MLLARDLGYRKAIVDREQRKEAREIAIERNVQEHVAPRGAHTARDVVERAVREPAGREMQREVLEPIHSGIETRPPPRHCEVDAAVHRRDFLMSNIK